MRKKALQMSLSAARNAEPQERANSVVAETDKCIPPYAPGVVSKLWYHFSLPTINRFIAAIAISRHKVVQAEGTKRQITPLPKAVGFYILCRLRELIQFLLLYCLVPSLLPEAPIGGLEPKNTDKLRISFQKSCRIAIIE
ncbi:MAG: hypothetical protein VB076_11665 [Synergistaceae bacterium]|nr:hypothetical protein [Synergistaceae bacterium]